MNLTKRGLDPDQAPAWREFTFTIAGIDPAIFFPAAEKGARIKSGQGE